MKDRIPAGLVLVALCVAVLSIAPFWWAQSQTPEGWTFTGVLNGSPDGMQYRVLADRSLTTGPIVDNRLTTEANTPHIAMFLYFGFEKLSQWLHAPVEFVVAYGGAFLALLLAFLVFGVVDHFLESRTRTWAVFLVLMFGGGLGAHLLLVAQLGPLAENYLIQRTVVEGLQNAIVFDQYRNHYLFTTLGDTHFLFFLLTALLAVGTFYFTLQKFSLLRLLIAASCFGAVTVLHIYDGVTLLAIGAGVCFLLWRKKFPMSPPMITMLACSIAVGAAIVWQIGLYRSSGIPLPPWRADSIYFSELALAYPVAWLLMIIGLGNYWRTAEFKETFLLGWSLGCVALTLSGPFYPYPDRGALTLQIPIYVIAGAIYFTRYPRIRMAHAILAILILGATPAYTLRNRWINTTISGHPSGGPPPYTWMSPEHQAMVALLAGKASEDDVLLVDKTEVPWRTDDLWLSLGFPGKLYAGHYALTVDYDRKREAVGRFFNDPASEEALNFLGSAGVRFVFVDTAAAPSRFDAIPGMMVLQRSPFGTLFEYSRLQD